MKQFRYLRYGLSVVLAFIGLKMLAEPFWEVPIAYSLSIIFVLIASSILASVAAERRERKR